MAGYKALKFCTGSSAKCYQCRFAIDDALRNKNVSLEELGNLIQEVIPVESSPPSTLSWARGHNQG